MKKITATYDGENHQAKAGADWMIDDKNVGISDVSEIIGADALYSILECFGMGKGTTGINHGNKITISIEPT